MPEQLPSFPTLIPPLGDELLADQALDAVERQVPETPDLAEVAQEPEPRVYGMSWQWDFGTGRFKTDGSVPARVSDLATLRVWAQTMLMIARNAHPIYDDDIGIEGGWGISTGGIGIGALASDPVVQNDYMKRVFDALMVHDRVTDVTNFDFRVDVTNPEVLYVDFELRTDGGDVVPMTMTLTES